MLDFKLHSVAEYLDHALQCKETNLLLGYDTKIEPYGKFGFKQNVDTAKVYIIPTSNKEDNFEFWIHDSSRESRSQYFIHYIKEEYTEVLQLDNLFYRKKFKKNGDTFFSYKIYKLDGVKYELEHKANTFSATYKYHTFSQKLPKNKTKEYRIQFKLTGAEIIENYNSKGVCTRSIFHFKGGFNQKSIQIHYKNNRCTFFCTDGKRWPPRIVLNLKDASILNLYNDFNCFNIDLKIDTELFDTFREGLNSLKSNIDYLVENETRNLPLLKSIKTLIEENTKLYEESI